MAAPAAPAGTLRPGRFRQAWFLAVVGALAVSLGNIAADIIVMMRIGHPPSLPRVTAWAWWLYLGTQVANKAPIAYRYPYRGTRAALEVAGFAIGLVGVGLLALGLSVPPAARLLFGATVTAWLLTGVVIQHKHDEVVTSTRLRIYCAVVAFLIPSLPLVLAWLLRPAA